jgi:hypothetical protein
LEIVPLVENQCQVLLQYLIVLGDPAADKIHCIALLEHSINKCLQVPEVRGVRIHCFNPVFQGLYGLSVGHICFGQFVIDCRVGGLQLPAYEKFIYGLIIVLYALLL